MLAAKQKTVVDRLKSHYSSPEFLSVVISEKQSQYLYRKSVKISFSFELVNWNDMHAKQHMLA